MGAALRVLAYSQDDLITELLGGNFISVYANETFIQTNSLDQISVLLRLLCSLTLISSQHKQLIGG